MVPRARMEMWSFDVQNALCKRPRVAEQSAIAWLVTRALRKRVGRCEGGAKSGCRALRRAPKKLGGEAPASS
jgi:hypothetical protein